jgi:hypothetical protein
MYRKFFIRDAAALISGSVFQHVMLFMMQAVVAQSLTVGEFGRLAFFNGLLSVIGIAGTAGISAWLPALSRRRMQVGMSPPHRMLGWALGFAILCSCLNAAAYALGAYRQFQVSLGPLYFWLSLTLVPICFIASVQGILVGYGKTRTVFRLNLCVDAARLLVPLVLVWGHGLGLQALIIGWAVLQWTAALVNLAIYLAWARGFPGLIDLGDGVPVREYWGWSPDHLDALAFLIPSGATLVLPRLLIFLTGMNHAAEETAKAAAAMIFMPLFGVLLIPYQTALLSHFQAYRSGPGLDVFLRKRGKELGFIIVSMGAAAWLSSWTLIGPVFGEEFTASHATLGLLVLAFATDAPRALLDVFFITLLPKGLMAVADLSRFLALGAVFLAPGLSFHERLVGVAALNLATNAFKAMKVAACLRGRDR